MRALMTSANGLTSLVSSAAVVVKGRLPKYNILLIFLNYPCPQCTHFAPDAQARLCGGAADRLYIPSVRIHDEPRKGPAEVKSMLCIIAFARLLKCGEIS